jgi:hypothetical protein
MSKLEDKDVLTIGKGKNIAIKDGKWYNTISHLKNYVKRLNNLASSFYLILAKSLGKYRYITLIFYKYQIKIFCYIVHF